MRIFKGLRQRFKLSSAFILVLITSQSFAVEVIRNKQELFEKAFEQSAEFQKISAQLDVDTIDAQSILSLYNWRLSGGVSRVDADRPITNPFSPNGQTSTVYNVKLEKENISGINPFVELTSQDSSLSFPNGNPSNFQTASIEAGLRVDLMKALFLKNSLQAFSQAGSKKEIATLSKLTAIQTFAGQISKAYYKALHSHKTFEILQTQCGEYSRLQRISSSRYKKKLIREQDFLAIEVLYRNCLLDKKAAENNKVMNSLALLKTAGLTLDTKLDLSKVDFPVQSLKSGKVDVEKNLNFQLATKVLKSSEQGAASVKSKLLPEVDFSYSLISEATGTSVGNSLGEAFGFDLLTHNLGINLTYEFGASAAKLEAKRALAFQNVKKYELVELGRSLERDAKTLSQNILYLNEGLSTARSLVKLQERKAHLFKKDFSNGRGGIRDLVEAQIAYLSSLEKSLLFQYNLSDSYIDLQQIKGETIAKVN